MAFLKNLYWAGTKHIKGRNIIPGDYRFNRNGVKTFRKNNDRYKYMDYKQQTGIDETAIK